MLLFKSAGGLSPSPQPLQDRGITAKIARAESELTGISVKDLEKRRLWLGRPGFQERFTADPE